MSARRIGIARGVDEAYKRDSVAEENPKALLMAGFDSALIGIGHRCGQPALAVYDYDQCIESLMGEGMTEAEAVEYFEFNTNAWVGDNTPLVLKKFPK